MQVNKLHSVFLLLQRNKHGSPFLSFLSDSPDCCWTAALDSDNWPAINSSLHHSVWLKEEKTLCTPVMLFSLVFVFIGLHTHTHAKINLRFQSVIAIIVSTYLVWDWPKQQEFHLFELPLTTYGPVCKWFTTSGGQELTLTLRKTWVPLRIIS